MTRKYRIISIILLVATILLNVAPLATYVIIGFAEADLVVEKVALTSTIFVVLILTIYSFVSKTLLRSRIWIMLLGLYFCLNNILTVLIIIAVCQVIDELIVNPLLRYYRNKYTINREIDKRIGG